VSLKVWKCDELVSVVKEAAEVLGLDLFYRNLAATLRDAARSVSYGQIAELVEARESAGGCLRDGCEAGPACPRFEPGSCRWYVTGGAISTADVAEVREALAKCRPGPLVSLPAYMTISDGNGVATIYPLDNDPAAYLRKTADKRLAELETARGRISDLESENVTLRAALATAEKTGKLAAVNRDYFAEQVKKDREELAAANARYDEQLTRADKADEECAGLRVERTALTHKVRDLKGAAEVLAGELADECAEAYRLAALVDAVELLKPREGDGPVPDLCDRARDAARAAAEALRELSAAIRSEVESGRGYSHLASRLRVALIDAIDIVCGGAK
jgi:hypothetical protein